MPLKPTSIKFTPEQLRFLQQTAKAQQHKQISKVVKRMVDKEMNHAS